MKYKAGDLLYNGCDVCLVVRDSTSGEVDYMDFSEMHLGIQTGTWTLEPFGNIKELGDIMCERLHTKK